jgi:hypothetical protein
MDNLPVDAVSLGLVMGLVGIAKGMNFPAKYAGLLSLTIGIVIVVGRSGLPITVDAVYTGIATGLAASGLYSGAKAVTQ